MVNCLQEKSVSEEHLDPIGRFKYTSSYQSQYDLATENLVEQLMDQFCAELSIDGKKNKSTIFISHDIDTIYGSFLQDGFWAVKHLDVRAIVRVLFLELLRKPHWKNMDKIIALNDEYDLKSTFFWLVNKGVGSDGIMNADYDLLKERPLLERVTLTGNVNGLHKSCHHTSIEQEIEKSNQDFEYNRYHFLNFQPHTDWAKLSESSISFDGSLGFAEHYGFRNSYGKAFQPFDIENGRPFDLVCAPLNFMDGTFHKYMKLPQDQVSKIVIDFLQNNPVNCDVSLLWHNTYFTDYKYGGFLKQYKLIAEYIYEEKIECVGPKELIARNKITW